MRYHDFPHGSKGTISLKIYHENHSTQVQRIPLDHAVFDLHFFPRDPSIFAVALSTAEVALYRIETTNSGPQIQFINTISVHEDPSQLSLCLAWIPPNLEPSSGPTPDGFAVSFSGGQISVFHANDPNTPAAQLTRENMTEIEFPGSPIEVWYVAFNSTKPSGHGLPSLFSGDDFSQLREFLFPGRLTAGDADADEDEDEDSLAPYQKFNDKGRNHNAGVTAILPFLSDETGTVLVTGSYDGNIRLYRLATRGQVLTELDLGGGVWRLKLIKSTTRPDCAEGRDHYILASCMHAGTRVVKLSYIPSGTGDEEWSFEVLVEFTEHESMNYASDFWLRENSGAGGVDLLCVSSSFYDKRVCVWNVES